MSRVLVARRGGVDLLAVPAATVLDHVDLPGQPMLVEVAPGGRIAWALTDVDGEGRLWTLAVSDEAISVVGPPVATQGGLPCSLAVDARGERLVVANYGGAGDVAGSLTAFALAPDGRATATATWAASPRSDPPTERHTVSHPHHVAFTGDVLRLVDMGNDRVTWFRGGPFADPVSRDLRRGRGPRWALDVAGRLLICAEIESVLLQLSGEVPADVDHVVEVPGASPTTNHPSELVALGPERVVLATRGSDRLVVVELPAGDAPRIVQTVQLPARWPASLARSADFVVVACRESGRVLGYRVYDGVLGLTPAFEAVADEPNAVRAVPRG